MGNNGKAEWKTIIKTKINPNTTTNPLFCPQISQQVRHAWEHKIPATLQQFTYSFNPSAKKRLLTHNVMTSNLESSLGYIDKSHVVLLLHRTFCTCETGYSKILEPPKKDNNHQAEKSVQTTELKTHIKRQCTNFISTDTHQCHHGSVGLKQNLNQKSLLFILLSKN